MNFSSSESDSDITDDSYSTDSSLSIFEDILTKLADVLICDEDSSSTTSSLGEPLENLSTIHPQFINCFHYRDTFRWLLKFEADHEQEIKKFQTAKSVPLRWKILSNGQVTAYLNLYSISKVMKLVYGDKVMIKSFGKKQASWSGIGHVIQISYKFKEITLKIESTSIIPSEFFEKQCRFSVQCLWNPIFHNKMQLALQKFASGDNSMSECLKKGILGYDIDKLPEMPSFQYRSAPNSPKLNQSQKLAVKGVIRRPLSLIHGPAGTGKTTTCVAIVYQLVKQYGGPVLVCAPYNKAVDILAEKIHKTNLKVVRLESTFKENLKSPIAFLKLQNQLQKSKSNSKFRKLQKFIEKNDALSLTKNKSFQAWKIAVESEFLETVDVICCTCFGADDGRLKNIKFRSLIIDNAGQGLEPECMIPAILVSEQIILVSDSHELRPIVRSIKAKTALSQSLFDRLSRLETKRSVFWLDTQYRMHPKLLEFSVNNFYKEIALENGITSESREKPDLDFPWPALNFPLMFVAIDGTDELECLSFSNRMEASIVQAYVTELLRCGIKPRNIGVITPYERQRRIIGSALREGPLHDNFYNQIEISCIDSFQGCEKDYIVMSCVRSNDRNDIGFLNDSGRLNVALTRAKYGLIIVGNPKVFTKDPLWKQFIEHCVDNGLLV